MKRNRVRIPILLPVAILVCLVLGIIGNRLVQSTATEEQLAASVLLGAIPFVLIFASIILAFITFIVVVAQMLNNRVSPRAYRITERIIIAGIVLGILGMFQSWVFAFYTYGFILLLISTLCFIVWSHVAPAPARRQAKAAGTTVMED
jgi:hypothetical protein